MPPVDRVADAFLHFEMAQEAERVFAAYDGFLRLLGDPERRDRLNAIKSREEAYRSSPFQEAVRIGDETQNGLLTLLFSPPLEDATRGFAIF